jgi:hypothetical protein
LDAESAENAEKYSRVRLTRSHSAQGKNSTYPKFELSRKHRNCVLLPNTVLYIITLSGEINWGRELLQHKKISDYTKKCVILVCVSF